MAKCLIVTRALFCFLCVIWRRWYFLKNRLSESVASFQEDYQTWKQRESPRQLGTIGLAHSDSAYKRRIVQHNQQGEENRYVLSRTITCIKLCGKCEMALRDHDKPEPSDFPIFGTKCEGNSRFQSHYDAQPVFKGTSSTIWEKAVGLMYEAYKKEISNWLGHFLLLCKWMKWLMCNESQLVLVLRYTVPNNTVTKHFMEFVEVKIKPRWAFLTPSNVYWSH